MREFRGVVGGSAMNIETAVKEDYEPSGEETFMNDRQKEFFRQKLQEWKDSILDQSRGTVATMQEDTTNIPDLLKFDLRLEGVLQHRMSRC